MSNDQVELRRMLREHSYPTVKVVMDGKEFKVKVSIALRMALASEYHWIGSDDRVRRMTPIRKQAHWHKCWRTAGAAVLEPGLDWGRVD